MITHSHILGYPADIEISTIQSIKLINDSGDGNTKSHDNTSKAFSLNC